MKYIILPFILFSCTYPGSQEVKVAGNLRSIMMDQTAEAAINMKRLESLPHLYAVGAVESLDGEITVVDGKAYVSSVEDGKVTTRSTFELNAALLVYSQVERFETIKPEKELNVKSLSDMLKELSVEKGIAQPFVFRLNGNAINIQSHVIKGSSDDHKDHHANGFPREFLNEPVELIGFYSEKHQGVFTHHGVHTHIHVIDPVTGMTAHVDSLRIEKNSRLLIPRKK